LIVPPASSQAIILLKSTSLVSYIGVADLLHATVGISLNNQRTIELLFVATIWYAVFTTLATILQRAVERHFTRSRSLVTRGERA
jgi:polar amino acid transport system permease protein